MHVEIIWTMQYGGWHCLIFSWSWYNLRRKLSNLMFSCLFTLIVWSAVHLKSVHSCLQLSYLECYHCATVPARAFGLLGAYPAHGCAPHWSYRKFMSYRWFTGQQILRKFLLPENFWVVMMDHFKVNINMILDLLYHVRSFRNMKLKFWHIIYT